MSASKTAPAQPSQPSRKGKKAWRKHVDITAVQAGLETLREEIIQHGRPLAEKAHGEIFALDTVGSSKEEVFKKAKDGHKIKVLKMDEILGRRSAVPALPSGKKRPLDARVTDGVVATKRQKTDWVSKKEVARVRSKLDKPSHLDLEDIHGEPSNFDLWDTTDNAVQPASASALASSEDQQGNEYIPRPKPKIAPPTIRRPPIALTHNGLPTHAVPTPDAGHSYNPSFEDWDTLLTREGEREIQAEQKRLAEAQLAAEKQARIDALAAQPERQPGDDGESEWEGFETETEVTESEMRKRKRPERKTPAQKNKLKRRKEAERLAKHEAKMGAQQKRGEEIIKALISRQEKEEQGAIQAAEPSRGTSALRRKTTLGPSRASILPPRLELVLPDELQDSLRRLKPEGNLLEDRFRNLLVNGKLEARKPVSYAASRKKQVKFTEKWWSKDFAIGA
ncbi:60S ribosome subunit biogenesis protein NOP53 [Cladophialophora carrionii]|uniref:Ribosome biogenesis protein NOP53 n=1 Tax=Cladophialophora carrionii TaxID=86049 RepID=A0A1C1C8H0_9EURO|nr:60S ribosome subunit biogenesis protein NOP53 [Cladophialophora carrionii]